MVDIPNPKSDFVKNISKIKDKTIRANLLLEYSLIQYGIKYVKLHAPITLLFPINIALPAGKLYSLKIKELKNFCSLLIGKKEYKREVFLKNQKQTIAVLDALCIKHIY